MESVSVPFHVAVVDLIISPGANISLLSLSVVGVKCVPITID